MDYSFEDFKIYKRYLNTIDTILKKNFEDQKEYICCKEGCSYCCETGQYPYSDIEFKYLLLGLINLPAEERQEIIANIQALKEDYKKIQNKTDFKYACPFLNSNKKCSVYEYRGFICRSFGLLKIDKNDHISIPFCKSLGLNYSKVYNKEENILDNKLVEKYQYEKKPKAYNLNFDNFMNKDHFEDFELEFGEIKSLVDWL